DGQTPSVTLPSLKSDSRDPAAALPDRRVEPPRKILTRSDRTAVVEYDRQEHLAKAHQVEPQAVFVVLGEALGIEDPSAAGRREALERRSVEPGPDAARRQKAPEALPHRDVLRLALGELVAI